MLHCDMRFNRARLVVVTLPALPQTLLRRRLLPAGLHYPMEASRTTSPGFCTETPSKLRPYRVQITVSPLCHAFELLIAPCNRDTASLA